MLTVKQIDAAKPAEKSYRLADSGGLFLFVPPSGKKVWRMRYRFEGKEKTLIYSVINSEAKRELLPLIRSIDEHAFINVVKTEELDGRFHDIPHD